MAAVLACGDSALLSHASAGSLWEITEPRTAPARGGGRPARGPEVTIPAARSSRVPGVTVHRRDLPASDRSRHHDIPVTSPIRTLLDLATALSDRGLEAAVNRADQLGLATPDSLLTQLEERAGQRGVAVLRGLLAPGRFLLTDSALERRFLPLARSAGLPSPQTGVRVRGFKIDFLWRDLGLVVETDGLRYHRTPLQQARDRRRDQALTEAGWTVLRFTHDQVAHRPSEVVGTLSRVARQRERLSS